MSCPPATVLTVVVVLNVIGPLNVVSLFSDSSEPPLKMIFSGTV